ncbi:hypothetical protein [Actinoalloteichus spitiensis]|uniref:hypothetical protein n=1 Tax=Actinoalloteichus spitiensis TaxID=252394 RepID=UPI0002D9CA55|nr:hypothetical protein [Actinoalloteichus spitiensis]
MTQPPPKLSGTIAAFTSAAAAGRVTLNAESAEAMASKLEAIADRAERRLTLFENLNRVALGSSEVAKTMERQDRAAAAGTPTSAKENLVLYVRSLREVAAAVRTCARSTVATDEANAATLNQKGVQPA